jgi:hypothetical protein
VAAPVAAAASARWSARAGAWTARREEAAMTSAMVLTQVAARVSRELYREFSVVFPGPVIAACVRDTLVDLHGSISTEALPEMAAALAKARLTGITDTRSRTLVRRPPTRGPSGSRLARRTPRPGAPHTAPCRPYADWFVD